MRSFFIALFCSVFFAHLSYAGEAAVSTDGAMLRALNKVNGQTVDLEIQKGQVSQFGSLKIALIDCRYPKKNRTGDSFAALEISEVGKSGTVFSGWMVASSPALNPMEHSRYDVWVLRCTSS